MTGPGPIKKQKTQSNYNPDPGSNYEQISLLIYDKLISYLNFIKADEFLYPHGSLQDRIGDTKCPTRFVNGFQYYLP